MAQLRLTVTLFLWALLGADGVQGQQVKDKWQRVYTGEESIIEINPSSLRFEPNHILRAQFRTIFSKPETLNGTKYKIRLETIDFKLRETRYRLFGATLLDTRGKVLESYAPNASDDWRILKEGGVMEKLNIAARALTPFGTWKVDTYRYAEGPSKSTFELEKLIGTRVLIHSVLIEVAGEVCTTPAFQDKRFTSEEFSRALGVELRSIGINVEQAETVNVKCEGSGSQTQSLIIKVSDSEMLMLWSGVFLVLKRERQSTNDLFSPLKPTGPTLKRVQPTVVEPAPARPTLQPARPT